MVGTIDYLVFRINNNFWTTIFADMGRGRSCTPELREIIIRKHIKEKKSIRQIAIELGCSKTKVHQAIVHFGSLGSTENKIRKQRPRKTTVKEDRRICRESKKNPFLTARKIRDNLATQISREVSVRTVRRRLCEAGLHGCIARKKPHVSKKKI